MLRLCPRGQENNAFFNCFFLNKLPRELCILLSEMDIADKQASSAREDSLAAHDLATLSLQEEDKRIPQWRQCVPGPAVVSSVVAGASEVEQTSAGQRRSPDTEAVLAAASRCHKLSHMHNRPGWGQAFASAISAMVSKPSSVTPPCNWSGN
jgi:hypothetical protein